MELEKEGKDSNKIRKRTKRLLNLIQQQLDFYFSDANLRHDRFLRKKIEDNQGGYVDLTIMLKFNKLKSLTTDVSMLAKAVDNSTSLQLSEDRTKLKKLSKLPGMTNTDPHTIYVEQLPAYVDHDWLKQVFSTCGTVDYISLPRYKHNNQVKGFAFIEFSNQQDAEKACQLLNTAAPYKKNRKRQSIDVKSTESSDTTKTRVNKRRRSRSCSESDTGSTKSPDSTKWKSKRRRSVSESSEESIKTSRRNSSESDSQITNKNLQTNDKTKSSLDCTKIKKRKHSESEANGKDKSEIVKSNTVDGSKTITVGKSKKYKPDNEAASEEISSNYKKNKKNIQTENTKEPKNKENVEERDTEEESGKKKKNRKHKKRKEEDVKELSVPPLYVISKTEWLNLKKQYKNIQRQEMSQLKKTTRVLKSEKVRQVEMKERIQETLAVKQKLKETDGIIPNTNNKQTHMKMERSKVHDITSETNSANTHISTGTKKNENIKLEVATGTVCLMKTSCEELTKKIIKSTLSKTSEVAYVDYIDGFNTGYIRFASQEMRDNALAVNDALAKSWKFCISALPNEDEKAYFQKADEDKRKKYEENDRKRKRKLRGTQKIANQVEKLNEFVGEER